ncbi:hypothetical protein C0585_05150 [Candidatus Woesearchaeota archaeon]|uniref:hypothetical protein n=1 Tax=uncultured Arcobacter sp. TaxID=165434 RepID=UPI000CC7645B|nr:hypothetical protein [uncultured Arcobacter sp.]PLW79932.1 MAG: hypothetical protein C0585_05150 [Candidatus Woesearchaeota archaeon]
MAKRKNLKSVAHNFQHSFMSLMNWWGNYFEDILTTAMLTSKETQFTLDMKTKKFTPSYFEEVEIIKKCTNFYSDTFLPKLIKSQGFDFYENIQKANMSIIFDFDNIAYRDDTMIIPYIANTILIDELQNVYSKNLESHVVLGLKTIDEIKEKYFSEYKNPSQLSQKD